MMEEEEPSPKKVTRSTRPFVAEDFIVREKVVIEMLSINFINIFYNNVIDIIYEYLLDY